MRSQVAFNEFLVGQNFIMNALWLCYYATSSSPGGPARVPALTSPVYVARNNENTPLDIAVWPGTCRNTRVLMLHWAVGMEITSLRL